MVGGKSSPNLVVFTTKSVLDIKNSKYLPVGVCGG